MDYTRVIDSITEDRAKEILNSLDIEYKDCGNYLMMRTYCHNHKSTEASEKLYYYFNNKIFMCYTSCGAQSWFKFLQNYYTAQEINYDWYHDIYELLIGKNSRRVEGFSNNKTHEFDKRTTLPELIKLNNYDENVLDGYIKYYPIEWLQDGISEQTMNKYNICFDSVNNKIIIPHYDIDNRLVGVRTRTLNIEEEELYGKYMPLCSHGQWYNHSLSMNLYGLNLAKESIINTGIVIIAEGEKSCMQADGFLKENNVVAACGSHLNIHEINILLKRIPQVNEIVLAFDQEEKDKRSYEYFNKLNNICKKYSHLRHFSFIYDRDGLLDLKQSPFDKGYDVFKTLYMNRVKC